MMTQREFLEKVMAMENVTEEVMEYAQNSLDKLNASNEKKRIKNAEKKAEKAPLYEKALEVLTNEFQTTSEIASLLELSTQATSPILRDLVIENKIEVTDKKVKSKGTQKAYRLA